MHDREARVVLITGASSGIGRAVAHRLASRGDRLVLSSRSPEALAEVERECRERGADPEHLLVLPADVREADRVDALFETAVDRFGTIDAVVHSAGALAYGTFAELPAEVFDATIRTNLGGTSHVARAALRRFHEQDAGHLVVVGSVLGEMAAPTMSAYTTSKWALHGLVRTLQLEVRDQPGIDVSLVSPGGVDTPIYRQAGTWTGRHGAPPPPVVSADRVADVICRVLERPRREVGVGPANPLMVLGFRAVPAVFDTLVGPLFARLAQGRRHGIEPTSGNLFQPNPSGEAISGGYGRWGSQPEEGTTMSEGTEAEHRKDPGPTISRSVAAPPASVWAVLADGWSYANWVVGAARVRDVDPGWPAEGTRVHHSFGLWPALIQDFTRVEKMVPLEQLELIARGWPVGEAHIRISVRPEGAEGSIVTITEDAVSGPGKFIPPPVRHVLLGPRNREALHRLALLAEGHYRSDNRSA